MGSIEHPEVLAGEWVPPVLLGRAGELASLSRLLAEPRGAARSAAVVGPTGAGTSTLARAAARELLRRLRGEMGAPEGVVLSVRTRYLASPRDVVTTLIRELDPGYLARGFPVAELLAGLFRRIRRSGRPTVVVLDDIAPTGPDLSLVVRAMNDPERFLPEGAEDLPGLCTLFAASPEGMRGRLEGLGVEAARLLSLSAYTPHEIAAIASDRVRRAFGRPLPPEWAERWARRVVAEGGGASRLLDILRRELLPPPALQPGSPLGPREAPVAIGLEPWVMQALGRALEGRSASLREVRRWEAHYARAAGRRPLPATTFWRRIVRLEAIGLVRRSVRPGGPGGTRSTLEVLRPLTEWPALRAGRETRPAAAVGFPGAGREEPPLPGGAASWAPVRPTGSAPV